MTQFTLPVSLKSLGQRKAQATKGWVQLPQGVWDLRDPWVHKPAPASVTLVHRKTKNKNKTKQQQDLKGLKSCRNIPSPSTLKPQIRAGSGCQNLWAWTPQLKGLYAITGRPDCHLNLIESDCNLSKPKVHKPTPPQSCWDTEKKSHGLKGLMSCREVLPLSTLKAQTGISSCSHWAWDFSEPRDSKPTPALVG